MSVQYDHLHLRSADPDAAAAAYAAWFGATVSDRRQTREGTRLRVDLGGLILLIEQAPPDTPAAPPPSVLGIEHIALRVADLDHAAATLRSQGVHFLTQPYAPRPGVRIAFVQGPDGVRLEIVERARTE